MTKKNKWWLNGGRGSGRTFRLLWETYENKITELKRLNSNQAKSLRVTMLEEEKKGKRIKELEQQIEKMKNCYNCEGYYTEQCLGCEDYSNWELTSVKELKENG